MDEVIESLNERKVPHKSKKGKLSKHRVYLAGPIDHAHDDGIGWRQRNHSIPQENAINYS